MNPLCALLPTLCNFWASHSPLRKESDRVGQVNLMRYGVSLRFILGGLLASAMPAGLGFAQQQVISAQSGTVQYVEGTVYADGKKVEKKFGQFPSLRPGDELRTEDGRAEMLLTPGAFLRLDDHSSVNMVSNHLTDTRVDVSRGVVMVECDELLKDNAISLSYRGSTIQLEKQGLYRLDTQTAEFRVYEGEARVQSASGEVRLKGGHETSLNGVLASQHFSPKLDIDDFYHWSAQRSSNLAYATITASQSVLNTGTTWTNGGWMWSGLLDEYTFLPGAGLLFSPFGYGFYSPLYMGYYYTPLYAGGIGGGLAPVSSFGTHVPGTQGTGRSATGTGTNPRAGTPGAMPGLAISSNSLRAGSSYGGVAAVAPRSFSAFGNSRGGFGSGPASGFGGSGAASSSASSSGGLRGGGGFSGGHGGGFGGGHR
jgi:hypothetical protein